MTFFPERQKNVFNETFLLRVISNKPMARNEFHHKHFLNFIPQKMRVFEDP